MLLRFLTVLLALTLAAPLAAEAQKPIKVGFPMILSGPGALFGEPALKGAQMYVDELNAKGGVLGRKIELLPRDTKGNADEAVRVSRELILKENVDFRSVYATILDKWLGADSKSILGASYENLGFLA